MKKLVLAALLVGASSAGCVGSGASANITMSWSFEHVDNGGPGQCPATGDTAQIVAQRVDTTSHAAIGKTFVDQFDCTDGIGTSHLPDGAYVVWVEIVNGNNGAQVFAQSEEVYVDTLDGNQSFSVKFLDDGGFFSFTWDLVDASNRIVSCRDAGVVGGDTSVSSIATNVANKDYFKNDLFDCEDHFGLTDGLRVGTYTVAIDADDGTTRHTAPAFTNVVVKANFVTAVGNARIPIDD